jgi:flagellar biosynthesis chaperone FliJ
MNGADIIREVQENASEWLEMSENPAELMAGILANKIVQLNNYIEYLEKRIDHDSRQKIRVN